MQLPKLTRRGRAVLVSSVALACSARLLGLVELYVLAAGAATLVVAALAYVATRRLQLDVERGLHPSHVHAGGASRVIVRARNRGSRRSPLVALVDRMSSGPASARLLLAPMAPDQSEAADYRFPADERGVFRIGPMTGAVTDPFQLASRSSTLAGATELTVYPRLDRVQPPARQHGGPEDADSRHASVRSQSGGDFAGLRAYQIGDDLRRVHWPSTARTGDIMIRQHEVSRQGRVSVAIDVATSAHSDESFETVLSAAASVIGAAAGGGCSVRLIASDGYDSGYGAGTAHLHRLYGYLARLDLSQAGPHGGGAAASGSGHRPLDGAVVLLATSASHGENVQRLAAVAPSPDAVTVVLFDAGSTTAGAPGGGLAGAGRTLHVAPDESFAGLWDRAQAAAR